MEKVPLEELATTNLTSPQKSQTPVCKNWSSSIFTGFKTLLEILVSNVFILLCTPLFLFLLFILVSTRALVSFYLRIKHPTFSLLKGRDAAWAYQKYAHDNSFHSFYKIQGRCDIHKIRSRITNNVLGHRTHSTPTYYRLSRKITTKFGFYCWDSSHSINIEDHVVFLTQEPLTETQLLTRFSSVLDKPLDSKLPQWKVYVIPHLVTEDSKPHYGLIWRMNHAIMDGVSAANALQFCIADAPVKLSVDPLAPVKMPFYVNIGLVLQTVIFGARSFFKSMFWNDKNPFHGPELTGPKFLGLSRSLNVEALKIIKNSTNTSITAVMTSCVGRGIRSLATKERKIPESVSAGATYALLPYCGIKPQNRFTVAHMELKVGTEESLDRLKSTYKSAESLCGSADLVKNYRMISLAGLLPTKLVGKVMNRCHATVLLSNLPGPVDQYEIFGGDKLVGISGWNTIKGTTGIGVCLFSYGGIVRAGFIADGAVLKYGESDLKSIMDGFHEEIKLLSIIFGIPEHFLFKD